MIEEIARQLKTDPHHFPSTVKPDVIITVVGGMSKRHINMRLFIIIIIIIITMI